MSDWKAVGERSAAEGGTPRRHFGVGGAALRIAARVLVLAAGGLLSFFMFNLLVENERHATRQNLTITAKTLAGLG